MPASAASSASRRAVSGDEHLFEVLAGLGADALDHLAALADDDRLLRFMVHENRREDPRRLTLDSVLELIDHHCCGVRQFLARVPEHFFADELGGERALGLIGEVLLRVQRRPFGQGVDDFGDQRRDPVARERRDRHDRAKRRRSCVVIDQRQQLRLPDQVDLVERQHRWRLTPRQQIQDEPIAGARTARDIDDQHDDVDLTERIERRIDHPAIHPVHRLVNPRRVDEHELRLRQVLDADDPMSGGLRLVGDDGEFLPDEVVEQRGLTRVGPPDQRDEPGPHADSSSAGGGSRQMRTL
jgi:hypothetical protein